MKALALAALLAGLAGPVAAQDPESAGGDGWDVETDAARDTVVASIVYEGGIGVAVACRSHVLDVILLGLPAASPAEIDASGNRLLSTGPAVTDLEQGAWRAEAGSTIASGFLPARRARNLKHGGELVVQTVSSDATVRPRRLRIPLPADSAGIDQALTACGQKLADPHDALPTVSAVMTPEMWRASRLFEIPAADAQGVVQKVEVSCVVQPLGRVGDCQVESETLPGLGDRVLAQADQVRLGSGDEAESALLAGRVLYLSVISRTAPL